MRRTRLLELARSAGLQIQDEGFRHVIWGKGRTPVGVAVYSDGSAHRADVDLSITKNMTITECASVLDLNDTTK